MTDRLKSRIRELPNGYQFGDAMWRAPHENAAERIVRQFDAVLNRDLARFAIEWPNQWNDIERGEH